MAWFRKRPDAPEPEHATAAHMRRALHRVLAGDLAGAEAELAEAAREDSSSAEVYLALANLYRARGEIGRAIQIHQNLLLRKDIEETLRRESLLGLALDFRAGGFLRRAAASFEELLEIDPDNATGLRELERIRVESGDWEAAIQLRKRVGKADPHSPQILAHLWTGLGKEREKTGQESDARKAFKRALGHDRRCAEAYIALGDQKLREGKPRKAVGLWQRALPLHSAIGGLIYPRLWEGYGSLDDLGALEKLLAERMEEEPSDFEAALWLARTVVRQGRIDEGLALLRRQLDRQTGFLAAHAEIGRTLLADHRDAEALKAFEELLSRLPADRPRLRCRSCGGADHELHWRCPQCGAWDSFV